jgi:hypothetical protein
MKSGAGDDPFAETDPDDGTTSGETPARGDGSDGDTEPEPAPDARATKTGGGDSAIAANAIDDGVTPLDAAGIPWVLRRGSVKDDRPNVTQFFLRDETDRGEQRLKADVEERLDGDVYTLDLREATYRIAMRHPDEIAEELRSWGYDYLD